MPSQRKMESAKRLPWLNWNTVATVLITKLLILGFAYQSYQIVTDQPLVGAYKFLEIWRHWDADNYLRITEFGYSSVGDQRFLIVFFPLFPLLSALVAVITRDALVGSFVVVALSSVALGLVFRELVKLDHPERIARNAVLFLFIFPTSYFLHIPYTESLFLALVVGCFLAARKRSWLWAGLLGGLACLTRINGLVLIPALAFEVWTEYRETKAFSRRWLALLLIPTGFAVYLGINYSITGDPLKFMEYQREHWYKYLRLPHTGLWETFKIAINDKPEAAQTHGFQELLFVSIGLFATIAGWRRMRNSYRVWMVGNWLLFVSTSFILSVPRYTLILFPMFILMAISAARNWTLHVLFIVWSGLFLALFSTEFVRGWWAF